MRMTRDQFKELMGLEEGSDGLEYADLEVVNENWWELAKQTIATTNILLLEMQ